MKTINLTLKMLLFVSVLALWSSCSKNEALEDIEIPTPINPSDDNKDDQFMVVCEHVCDVANKVVKYHEASNSIDEMEQFLDDIKQIEYVEDVYTNSMTMFVKIKDYGVISYSFFPKEEPLKENKQESMMKMPRIQAASNSEGFHPLLGLENAVVVNQQDKDEDRPGVKNIASNTLEILKKCGLDAKPNNSPDIEFFRNGIFDYDVVFLITHGEWDSEEQLHWLLTSVEASDEEVSILNKDKLFKYRNIDRDKLSIAFVDEERNKKKRSIAYFKVSEKFINSSSKSFNKNGKAIFFNTACQSLMDGNNDKNHFDNNLKGYSLANVLDKKGVGAYFGYDESGGMGSYAGFFFFMKLAAGMSIERAYESLPEECLHQEVVKKYWSGLIKKSYNYVADLVPNNTVNYSAIKKSCINAPTIEFEDKSNEKGINFLFKGQSLVYRAKDYYDDDEFEEGGAFPGYLDYNYHYGFELSESANFSDPIQVEANGDSYTNNIIYYSVSFTHKELKYGTTYYFRGLFYDGQEVYYLEHNPGHFTTKSFGSEGSTTVPDVPGSNF